MLKKSQKNLILTELMGLKTTVVRFNSRMESIEKIDSVTQQTKYMMLTVNKS